MSKSKGRERRNRLYKRLRGKNKETQEVLEKRMRLEKAEKERKRVVEGAKKEEIEAKALMDKKRRDEEIEKTRAHEA